MDSNLIYKKLKEKGYAAELSNQFIYNADKDRRFNTVSLSGEVNREIISLVDRYGGMLVACTHVDTSGETPVFLIKHDVYPKDMKSFDWSD